MLAAPVNPCEDDLVRSTAPSPSALFVCLADACKVCPFFINSIDAETDGTRS